MRLHVLAGCRDLLSPVLLAPEVTVDLVSSGLRLPTAFWISDRCGCFYHDFLQDGPDDRRLDVFALSLRENFGERFEPLLVLPDLLEDGNSVQGERALRDQGAVEDKRSALAVLAELCRRTAPARLHLHAVTLAAEADPEAACTASAGITPPLVRAALDRLCDALAARGVMAGMVETRVIGMIPDHPAFQELYRNAVANQITRRLANRLDARGWVTDRNVLRQHVADRLKNQTRKGISLGLHLNDAQLEKISADLEKQL